MFRCPDQSCIVGYIHSLGPHIVAVVEKAARKPLTSDLQVTVCQTSINTIELLVALTHEGKRKLMYSKTCKLVIFSSFRWLTLPLNRGIRCTLSRQETPKWRHSKFCSAKKSFMLFLRIRLPGMWLRGVQWNNWAAAWNPDRERKLQMCVTASFESLGSSIDLTTSTTTRFCRYYKKLIVVLTLSQLLF